MRETRSGRRLSLVSRMRCSTKWCTAKPGPNRLGPGSAAQRYTLRCARDTSSIHSIGATIFGFFSTEASSFFGIILLSV